MAKRQKKPVKSPCQDLYRRPQINPVAAVGIVAAAAVAVAAVAAGEVVGYDGGPAVALSPT